MGLGLGFGRSGPCTQAGPLGVGARKRAAGHASHAARQRGAQVEGGQRPQHARHPRAVRPRQAHAVQLRGAWRRWRWRGGTRLSHGGGRGRRRHRIGLGVLRLAVLAAQPGRRAQLGQGEELEAAWRRLHPERLDGRQPAEQEEARVWQGGGVGSVSRGRVERSGDQRVGRLRVRGLTASSMPRTLV